MQEDRRPEVMRTRLLGALLAAGLWTCPLSMTLSHGVLRKGPRVKYALRLLYAFNPHRLTGLCFLFEFPQAKIQTFCANRLLSTARLEI